jgi:hypothetical protein
MYLAIGHPYLSTSIPSKCSSHSTCYMANFVDYDMDVLTDEKVCRMNEAFGRVLSRVAGDVTLPARPSK